MAFAPNQEIGWKQLPDLFSEEKKTCVAGKRIRAYSLVLAPRLSNWKPFLRGRFDAADIESSPGPHPPSFPREPKEERRRIWLQGWCSRKAEDRPVYGPIASPIALTRLVPLSDGSAACNKLTTIEPMLLTGRSLCSDGYCCNRHLSRTPTREIAGATCPTNSTPRRRLLSRV
jgi:hypothetical protein